MSIEVIRAPFACEIYTGDDAAVAAGIEEFMMICIKAGIENGDANAGAIELACGRGGKAANLIDSGRFFNVAGDLCGAVERNVHDVVACGHRRQRRDWQAEADGIEVGEGALDSTALPLHCI